MFKNIRIKKKGGGTRTQRVQVLASGKYKFVKNLTKRRGSSKSKTKRASNPKRRVKNTAKRKRRGKRGSNLQAKIFKFLRLGALVAPAVGEGLRWRNQPEEIAPQIVKLYTGYYYPTGQFEWNWLAQGWTAFLMTSLATTLIPKITGMIRRL